MNKVASKDGTQIAYDKLGKGLAVMLVSGATADRGSNAELAGLLASDFTVFNYDRRGRGDSGTYKSASLQSEIEDLQALIGEAGGSACVYGISSGGCLVLEAALKLGRPVAKIALYEPPYDSNPASVPAWDNYRTKLKQYISEDRRGEAIVLFMQLVGLPEGMINGMRQQPMWAGLEKIAPTLILDSDAMGGDTRAVPTQRAEALKVPALILDGGGNLTAMPFMHASATALAKAIPHAEHRTLEGQTHDVKPQVLAPLLTEFFKN
jgi:pimeloyl-ACP methyl ester carboxylesterase